MRPAGRLPGVSQLVRVPHPLLSKATFSVFQVQIPTYRETLEHTKSHFSRSVLKTSDSKVLKQSKWLGHEASFGKYRYRKMDHRTQHSILQTRVATVHSSLGMGELHRGQPLSRAQSYIGESSSVKRNEALMSSNENDKVIKIQAAALTQGRQKMQQGGVTTKYNLSPKESNPLARQSRGHSRVI